MIISGVAACGVEDVAGGGGGGEVTYKVTGDGVPKADMTFTDGGTQTTTENGKKLPWTKKITAADDVLVYQVLAQNAGMQKGKITCSIEIDGEVVTENTSSGAAAIATCEHSP
jgi:hypothetical protein